MKEIYYEKIGEGFPIILLHGNGENHHIFDEAVERLSKHYCCVCIDSRYHGQSIHQGELSYDRMYKDIISVVDKLQIDEYDVIGFSDGGIVGLLLAMHDQRLKHMIVMGANTKPQNLKLFYRVHMYLQWLCLLPFCLYNRKARLLWKLNMLMIKEPHIDYDDLHQIVIPTLVMAGEYDMVKKEDSQMIAKSLPYGIFKEIKHANHFLLRDSFLDTMMEIELFLQACHKEEK